MAALLGVAAVAWVTTSERMAGMDAGPGTAPGSPAFYVSAWVVMMAAMMFPSVWPTVSAYATVDRSRGPAAGTAMFVGGYVIAWTAFGLLAYGVFEAGRSLDVDALAWDRDGPYLAAAVIALAALYQLTPLKDACLSRCRNPVGFVVSSWREGRRGALVMGIHHGGWCIGCCWALMAVLFAVGVMSVAWMAVIALFVAAEKLLPWGRAATAGIAVILIALAIGIASAPEDVPGLTVPDSGAMSVSMDR